MKLISVANTTPPPPKKKIKTLNLNMYNLRNLLKIISNPVLDIFLYLTTLYRTQIIIVLNIEGLYKPHNTILYRN